MPPASRWLPSITLRGTRFRRASLDPDLDFPYLLLLVSGGHCQLLEVKGVGNYSRLATTIDDAAGEAFDKAAKLLGLSYPGGPAIEALATRGDPDSVPLPRPLIGSGEPHFSFAGLKSAVQRAVASGEFKPEDIAASFQQAVIDCLVDRTRLALGKTMRRRLVVAGGVAANSRSAHALAGLAQREGRRFSVPPAWLCTDNAAMIAWAGAERFAAGLIAIPSMRRPAPAGPSIAKPRKYAARGSKHEARRHRRRRMGHRARAGCGGAVTARPCCGRSSRKWCRRSTTGMRIRPSSPACRSTPRSAQHRISPS